MRRIVFPLIIFLCPLTTLVGQEGTLRMQFVVEGPPPPQQMINLPARLGGGFGGIVDEKLLVDKLTGGIQNVVVYLTNSPGAPQIQAPTHEKQTLQMVTQNGRFSPHILVAHTGDVLQFFNRDPLSYSPNVQFLNNTPASPTIAPQHAQEIHLAKAEPAAIPVDCLIHPWMKAYIFVLEHPYAGVSDEEGHLEIRGLPAGQPLTFRFWCQAISGEVREPKLGGVAQSWPRNRFVVEIKAGINDLGTIAIPTRNFAR